MDFIRDTGNKIGSSRIMKFAMIGMIILLVLKLISYGMALIISSQVMSLALDDVNRLNFYKDILRLFEGDAISAIGMIVTAVVARYGLRETARSFSYNRYNKPREDKKGDGDGVTC